MSAEKLVRIDVNWCPTSSRTVPKQDTTRCVRGLTLNDSLELLICGENNGVTHGGEYVDTPLNLQTELSNRICSVALRTRYERPERRQTHQSRRKRQVHKSKILLGPPALGIGQAFYANR